MPETSQGLTYPASNGHTRIWEHLQELASDVDRELVERAVVTTPNTGKRFAWKLLDGGGGSLDVNGKFTFTHGLGFTPTIVVACSANPSSRFAAVWGVDAISATQLTVRFLHPTSTAVASGVAPAVFIFAGE